jgi:hypothetical protein
MNRIWVLLLHRSLSTHGSHHSAGMPGLTWDGIATIVAAIIAAIVVVAGYVVQQRISRRQHQATIYSQAIQAVEDYVQAPYRIQRKDGSSETRQILIRDVSDIQSRLAYFESMLEINAPDQIAAAYRDLVQAARNEAGTQMTAAWRAKPIRSGRDVPLTTRFDRSRTDAQLTRIRGLMRSNGH